MTRVIVVGDVCRDELIYGVVTRFSRDTPAIPVLDVHERVVMEGGAANTFRQVQALGADAFLVPTGLPATKTRLVALSGERDRELARMDDRWPRVDPELVAGLIARAGDDFDAAIYSQYRPGRPDPAVLKQMKRLASPRIGDVREPSHFTGVLNIIKVAASDAWEAIERPRPRRTHAGAMNVARAVRLSYGYDVVVVTMGVEGYVAVADDGREVAEGGLSGALRSVGAGDIFTATLAVLLARGEELTTALSMANTAAGLSCRKDEHLPTVSFEEVQYARSARTPVAPQLGEGE